MHEGTDVESSGSEESAAATDDGGVWAPERRRLTTGLVLTVTLVAFESLAISAVLPEVEEDLGGLRYYGWVFSGFFLASLLGIVVAGQVADRRSARVPFGAGLVLFAAGLLAGGAAPSMPVLVTARLFQGVGAGVIPAVAYTCVGRAYPPALRPRVFAVFSTAWVVPGLIGPSTAKGIAHATSWRGVFLALLPLVALAAAITLPALRAVGPPESGTDRAAVDRRAVVFACLLIAGTGLFLAGLTSVDLPVLVPLVVVGAPVAAAAFVRLVPPGTVRAAPGLPAIIAVRGVLTFAFFGTDAFVPLVLEEVRHEPGWVAVALTAVTITWTAGSWIQQRVVHTLGPRRLVGRGLVLVAVGILGAAGALGPLPVPAAVALYTVAGLGIGLCYGPLSAAVLATAAPGEEGVSTAALQLSDTLGVSLGTGLTGVFVAFAAAGDDPVDVALALAFAVTVSVALFGSLIARRLPATL